jgi:molybdopterin-guanine dinucleotide biosynthesis protein A
MPRRFENVTGFVLAGGESRRMGRPKADLILNRETMVERQLHLLSRICRQYRVVAARAGPMACGAPAIKDVFPMRGPLGGIHAALESTRTEHNLVIGCDLPFLEVRFLEYLCRRAMESGADAVIPQTTDRRLQPLCAVYRRRTRRALQTSLEQSNERITRALSSTRCEILTARELARHGFRERMFVNMNTPADYDAARRMIEARPDY